jgi:hypothetical protein
MRGLRYQPGKSWPRNPAPADPQQVRQRTRSHGLPISGSGLGL